MSIQSFYKNKIILNSKNNVSKYLSRFKDKKVTIYYDEDTYTRYKEILELDSLNIFELINIDTVNTKSKLLNQNTDVLVLVKYFSEYFVDHMHIYKYLHNNKLYTNDIYADLLLDMDILIDDTFSLLWDNIVKLESMMDKHNCNFILEQEYDSYLELFKNMLLNNNLIQDNDARALIQQDIYNDTFGDISENIKNLIVLCARNNNKYNFFYGINYLRFFTFIDFFIGTSLTQLPLGSKFININHGIVDDPGGFVKEDEYTHKVLYDFFKKNNLNKIDISIYSCDLIAGDKAISLGYPKLDKFIRYYNKNKNKNKNRIVVAVSSRQFNFKNINPIVQDKEFLNDVLNKFNDYKVVFRPHPNDIKSEYVQNYKNNLKKYDNFEFDENKSYLDNFTNANVFISDGLGSSAYTYAFATLKPVIFYIPKLNKYLNDYGHNHYVKNLHIIGDVVTNREDLLNIITKYLFDDKYIKLKSIGIREFRDKNIFNIGSSEEKIASFINKYISIQNSKKIRKYYSDQFIKESKKKTNDYFDKFKNKKVAIYGAGEHFETVLLKVYDFSKLDIVCFSDSNSDIIGNYKYGFPIVSKDSLDNIDVILISSKKYEREIKKNLSKYYTNIYTIYEALNSDIDIYINSFQETRLTYSWLNIHIIEQRLNSEDVNRILNTNYNNYNDLFKDCQSILINKYNEKIYYTDSLRDIYQEDKLYCIN